MKTEKTILSGHLTIRVFDWRGNMIRVIETPNVVTNGAKAAIAKLLVPASSADQDDNQFWYLEAGDGTAAAAATDVALAGTKKYAKAFGTKTYNVGSVDGLVECVVTFSTSEGNVLAVGEYFTEAGLWSRGDDGVDFAASVGKTMCARQVHAQIHKDSSISLEYTWRFQLTPAP